jgi:hypothetical protein
MMTDPQNNLPLTQMVKRDLDGDVLAALRIGQAEVPTEKGRTFAVVEMVATFALFGLLWPVFGNLASVVLAVVPVVALRARRLFLPVEAAALERSHTGEPLLVAFRHDRVDVHRMGRFATQIGDRIESHPMSSVRIEMGEEKTDSRLAIDDITWPTIGITARNLRAPALDLGIPIVNVEDT